MGKVSINFWDTLYFKLFLLFHNFSSSHFQICHLRDRYSSVRRTRPDGNCFFRAVAFGYFAKLMEDEQELKRFRKVAEKVKNL